MFAFLRQMMEERRQFFENVKPAKSDKSMNINKEFWEILQLSFEAKDLCVDEKDEKIKLSKKKKKIKRLPDTMDLLYHDAINRLEDINFDDVVALAAAYYNIGTKCINSTKISDLDNATIYFSRCLELLKGNQLDRKAILTSISALNELNLVCEKMQKQQYTYKFLNTAMELYWKYTMKDYFEPIHIPSLVGIKEKESNPRIILETLHYTTLQDLGVQYILKAKDKHGFVLYLHKILHSRLTQMIFQEIQFDERYLDWALTLFDLYRYFIANGRFTEAKNHILTADYVICRFREDKLKKIKKKSKAQFSQLNETYDYVCALSARSWGTYGVCLLRFYVNKFSQNRENKSYEREIQECMSKLEINSERKELLFFDIEKELSRMKAEITETCISNLADAKSVFVKTLRQLDIAKEYFTPDTDIESYAKITLEISETYKYLAGFEERRDNQIKLHKRRVECLEDARKKFHTIIDVDTQLQIYKRIWYEIVTSCSTVMDLMVEETYYDQSFKQISEEVDRYVKMISDNIDFYINVV